MTAEVHGVSWGRGVVHSGTQWCYHEARRCNDAWRLGGSAATAAVLTTDVTQLLVRRDATRDASACALSLSLRRRTARHLPSKARPMCCAAAFCSCCWRSTHA